MSIRHRRLLLSVLLLGALARPGAGDPTAPPVYDPANGHWYQAVRISGTVTWPEARSAAAALTYGGYPGHLATVTSADENQFVTSLVSGVPGGPYDWWLGGYQDPTAPDYSEPAGGWRWITGEPWSYTNWKAAEPDDTPHNENALHISRFGLTWNDLLDSYPLSGYVVEYEPAVSPAPAGSGQLLLFPNPVLGGQPALGQVALAQPAGAGGEVLSLASSNPAAAVTPASVTVPAGASSATFVITTLPVAAPTPVAISAACAFGSVSAVLQVLPLPAPPAPTASGGNLLVNGSFEQPNAGSLWATVGGSGLPGWRVTRGNVDVVSGSYWQPAPDGGYQSLDLVGSQDGTIAQSFATEPGRDYLFSGWIAHNADNPVAPEGRADVTLNGQPFVQLFQHDASATRTDMRWVPFSYRFRATSSTTTLAIADVTHTWPVGGAALDGLSVILAPDQTPPPAPATTTAVTPTVPAALSAHALSSAQVALFWRDTSTNQTALAIWRRDGAHEWARVGVAAPNATTFTDAGLTPGTIYNYRVRAINSTVASDWSNTVTVRTPGG